MIKTLLRFRPAALPMFAARGVIFRTARWLCLVAGTLPMLHCPGGGGGGLDPMLLLPILLGNRGGSAGTTLYVSPTGSDSNSGTSATSPLLTISAALNKSGTSRINVAAGTYNTTTSLSLQTVGLYGGYSADFSTRNAATNVTTIAYTGSSYSIYMGGSGASTAESTLDGFTLTSTSTSTSTGVVNIFGGTHTINNNIITGQAAIYGTCSAACTATISGNTLTGGTGAATVSYGIYFSYPTNSKITISGNTIQGGYGSTNANGIYMSASGTPTGATVTITNNTVTNSGGTSNTNAGISFAGNGDSTSRVVVTLTGNTVTAGPFSSGSGQGLSFWSGYTVTMTNNTITAGNATLTSGTSYGIFVTSQSNLSITGSGNTIRGGNGGSSSGSSIAITFGSAVTTSLSLTDNVIAAGTGSSGTGVYLWGGTITLNRNTIFGGANNTGSSTSAGINVAIASVPDIRNNVIYGGDGSTAQGIVTTGSGTLKIRNNTIIAATRASPTNARGIQASGTVAPTAVENNIIYVPAGTNRYCLYDELTGGFAWTSAKNNDLFGCANPLYDFGGSCGAGGGTICNLSELNAFGGASGNITDDPVVTDWDGADNNLATYGDNNVALSGSTPASVKSGGLDLSADFTDDRPGTTRAVPFSIGAYE